MRNKSISKTLMAVTPMMIVCVVLVLGASGMAQSPDMARSDIGARDGISAPIEGSWILELSSSPGGGPPFTAVASFGAGGIFIATGQNDRGLGAGDHPVSELHGTWERIRENRYGSTTYFFALDPTTGQAVGMLQTNQAFKLTGKNELVGSANASICDLHGENCVSIPGITQGNW